MHHSDVERIPQTSVDQRWKDMESEDPENDGNDIVVGALADLDSTSLSSISIIDLVTDDGSLGSVSLTTEVEGTAEGLLL